MALNHHLIDNSVALIGSCAIPDLLDPDVTPVPTDPTTITFIRQQEDGTTTTYEYMVSPEVTRLAAGIYACVVTVNTSSLDSNGQAGREEWAFVTTGTCECRSEHAFIVDPSMLS